MSDAKMKMDVSSPTSNMCAVCGDVADGMHYGAISCNPCGAFFRRAIQTRPIYLCSVRTGECVINSATRDDCQFCRLKMCFAAKMKKTAVPRLREQRQTLDLDQAGPAAATSGSSSSREMTTFHNISYPPVLNLTALPYLVTSHSGNSIPDPLPEIHFYSEESSGLAPSQTSNERIEDHDFGVSLDQDLPADVNRFRRVAANIVVVCAYRARKNDKFAALPLSDQTIILAEVWVELFMLTAAYWPFDLISYAEKTHTNIQILLPRRVVLAITGCRELELDDFERSMMESIILAKKDCSRPLLATSAVNDMLNSSLTALRQSFLSKEPESAGLFGRALLALPNLRAIPEIYWRNMLGFSAEAIAHLLCDPSRNDPGGNSA